MRCRLLLWMAGFLLAPFVHGACRAEVCASAVVMVHVRVEPLVTLPPPEFDWAAFELDRPAWPGDAFLTNDPYLRCKTSYVREPADSRSAGPVREKRMVWVVLPGD